MKKKTYKPIPFYFITTNDMNELTYEKAYESLQTLKARGFGGAVLFNKPPHGFTAEEYLSDNWFTMIENFVKAGIDLDLEMWINDGFDYPPGSAAGRIEKIDPTLKQYHVKRVDGKIVTEAVDWGFPAFEHPKSSELFIELVYEAYKKRLGKYFGNGIRGFFSDADNRRVNYEVYAENSPKWDYFPWSEDFCETFKAKFSYDIWPYMDEILDRADSKHCVDYWQHASDLYADWFRKNHQWCNENGLEYTFHSSDTSPFHIDVTQRSSIFTEGRASDLERNCDYSGTDQELLEVNGGKHYAPEMLYIPEVSWGNLAGTRKSPDYYDIYADTRTKQAQSTAFVYDKKGAMCEMFAASNYGTSYEELREIAAFQIMQGITFVVPHAYQYRVLGATKYFAPPNFSDKSYMPHCRQFNDYLVNFIEHSDAGSLAAPIAVMDITEDIWQSKGDPDLFFAVCQQLNRMPHGFVIADKKGIEMKRDAFSLIINTTTEEYDTLSGIKVVNLKSIDELSAAVAELPTCVSYKGCGTPHFMVRNTDKGQCALVCNIENPEEISGTVTFCGNDYDVSLYPGEVAFFSQQEQIYRTPVNVQKTIELPVSCPVTWGNENVLPLACWQNKDGKTVLQFEEDDYLRFDYKIESPVQDLKLYVPASCEGIITKLEGVDLSSKREAYSFDDRYYCYDVMAKVGQNSILIEKNSPIAYYDIIFLSGEFDVSVEAENPFYKLNFAIYNLNSYIPEKAVVTLHSRSNVLDTTKSAALQGHPFYKGSVTYHMEADVPEDFGNYQLCVGNACNGVSVQIDDGAECDMIFRPYTTPLTKAGRTEIKLTTHATLGNFLEMYPREFGITEGVRLEKIR